MGEEMPHRFVNAVVLLRGNWCYNIWCFEGYMTSIVEGPHRYIHIVSSIYLSVSFLETFSTLDAPDSSKFIMELGNSK